MSSCDESNCGFAPESTGQKRTLTIVLGINAVMFIVIVVSAFAGRSASLLADSLDNLGDALTYALSLFVVAKGLEAKAKVALFKGALILFAAIGISAQVVYKIFFPVVPSYEIMGIFSLLALAANSVCLLLLWRHRHEDVNMSSVWECSRNDIATNLSVFAAAGGVWFFGSSWPDLLVALGLIIMLIRSALRVNASALRVLRTANT
ncbi:MAG: cation transporter [Pyrinomonadaceae bacterium]